MKDEIIEIKRKALKAITKLQTRIQELENTPTVNNEPIAIIGMACRYPGDVIDLDSFWKLLAEGKDAIQKIPADRWDVEALFAEEEATPGKMNTKEGGFLNNIDEFDANFFKILPEEAKKMDPQHRILLETTWQAFEHAGQSQEQLLGSNTGVFMGLMSHEYEGLYQGGLEDLDGFVGLGNAASILSGRISYLFGLKGPSLTLDTACSSSLVAIDLAVEKLRNRTCNMAVAGGVSLILTPNLHVEFSRSQGIAKDGRCRTFSNQANGTGWSEGCGVIVLKRLSDAQKDGDHILALIKGSAVNQDGKSQGLTAPNGPSQVKVIEQALEQAKVQAHEVDYVEAHGTGTQLGDPIEVQALGQVYGKNRKENKLTIGSVKSNIGHTMAAAGVAGLIKTVLSLQQGLIPKSLHTETLSEQIDWDNLGIKVAQNKHAWNPKNSKPKIAGISSFGISGTNAHLILEEAPKIDQKPDNQDTNDNYLIALSSESEEGLAAQLEVLKAHIQASPALTITNISYSLAHTRSHFSRRKTWVVQSKTQLSQLKLPTENSFIQSTKTAFLFTGGGAQFAGMGKALYESQPIFKQALDSCITQANLYFDADLKSVLFCEKGSKEEQLLHRIDYMQVALFAHEYATAKLLQYWGVEPDVLIGHSLGEIVAATLAGVFSLEDGIKLISERGKLMNSIKTVGMMASIQATEQEVLPLLKGKELEVSIGVINSDNQLVISGKKEAVETICQLIEQQGKKVKRLQISTASHSPLMEEVLDKFRSVVSSISFNKPIYPLVSNATGTLASDEIQTVNYWVDHLRNTVRFSDGIKALENMGVNTFFELGANPVLLGIAGQVISTSEDCIWLATCQEEEETNPEKLIFESLGRWHEAGNKVNWKQFHEYQGGQRVSLPTYAFQRQSYWLDRSQMKTNAGHYSGYPFLGSELKIAGESVFQNSFSLNDFPYLIDHQVFDVVVIPGAGLCEIIQGFIAQLDEPHQLSEIIIQHPIILQGEQAVHAQLVTQRLEDGGYEFTLYSENYEHAAWTVHAKGIISLSEDNPAETVDIEELIHSLPQLAVDDFYSNYHRVGMQYGTAFQAVEEIYLADNQVIGKIHLQIDDHNNYGIHPSMLDGIFQLTGALFQEGEHAYMPFEINDYHLLSHNHETIWASSTLLASGSDFKSAQIDLWDEAGNAIGKVGKVYARKVTVEQLTASIKKPFSNLHHQLEWHAVSLPTPKQVAGNWFWIADEENRSTSFESTIQQLESTTFNEFKGQANFSAYDGIIISLTEQVGNYEQLHQKIEDLSRIIQHILKADSNEKTPIYLISQNAFDLDNNSVNSYQACLWGYGKALALEQPLHWGALIDLPQEVTAATQHIFTAILKEKNQEKLLAIRASGLYAQKLKQANLPQQGHSWQTKGTALITGGTGALGLATAHWLIEKGIEKLVLLSRSGEQNEKAQHILADLKAKGVQVTIKRADVSNEADLKTVFGELEDVKVIIHAAGYADQILVESITKAHITTHLKAKIKGTDLLTQFAQQYELDAFICYSSIASVWGSASQALYGAANAYLDAWVTQARALGIPAFSTNWGLWKQGGMVTEDIEKELLSRGLKTLTPSAAFASLESQLLNKQPSIAAVSMDWAKFKPLFELTGLTSLLSEITIAKKAKTLGKKKAKSQLRKQVLALPKTDRQGFLASFIQQEIADFLNLPNAKQVSLDSSLKEQGINSLMAVELRNKLVKQLTIKLPATVLFEYPEIHSLSNYLVNQLADNQEVEQVTNRSISKAQESPLASMQERLWFIQQFDPNNPAYNTAITLDYQGELSLDVLENTFKTLTHQHENLRSTIQLVDGKPLLKVLPNFQPTINVLDLSREPKEEQQEKWRKFSQEQQIHLFDFQTPALQVHLVQFSDQHSKLLIIQHHIFTDGWSIINLAKELISVYESMAKGLSPKLPVLEASYMDFIQQEQAYRNSEQFKKSVAYWAAHLQAVPQLDLPTQKSGNQTSFNGDLIHFEIGSKQTKQLRELAAKQQSTMNSLLFGLFSILLHKYTQQTDFAIGALTANRHELEYESLQGFFVNTMAWRTQIIANQKLTDYIKQTDRVIAQHLKHQEVPFQDVVREVAPTRANKDRNLYNTSFVYQEFEVSDLIDPKSNWYMAEGASLLDSSIQGIAKDDLALAMAPLGERLRGELVFKSDLFDRAFVAQMAQHFSNLIEAVLANSEQEIREINILSETDRHYLLETLNNTKTSGYQATNFIDLFETQASNSSQQLALQFRDEQLSFQELNERANQIAHFLQSQGISKGDLIPVCLERSTQLVISLLGILKAGASYIPLDPIYPKERIAHILEDSKAAHILTEQKLLKSLPSSPQQIILVDHLELSSYSRNKLETQLSHQDSAYVIYTSGSTGKPKGVEISHGALLNFLLGMQDTFGLSSQDNLLAVTTVSFDIAGLELYLPLITGATLYLAPHELVIDGQKLIQAIDNQNISILQATPATWQLLLANGWLGSKKLKALVGGEALSKSLAKALLNRCAELWNMYGPTETTIWSSCHQVQPTDLEGNPATAVSIGNPISNTQIYLLDKNLQPTPLGVAGELCIGGQGLAQGYLYKEKLTAERFVNNPFGDGQLYRTGDLACYNLNGELTYLGRLDHQVKLRGYRIELGEIETQLLQYELVKEVVVVLHEHHQEKLLVAYYTANDRLSEQELKTFLKEFLPNYMIPQYLIKLDTIPLTPNGKTNRLALSQREVKRKQSKIQENNFSSTAQQIAQLWKKTLGLDSVSLDDNFFDAGGHSLLLVNVHQQLQEHYPFLEIVDFFTYPTLRTLSAYLDAQVQPESESVTPTEKTAQVLSDSDDIAIIGMAGKFPKADDLDTFWENIKAGVEAIQDLPENNINDANYINRAGVLSDIESFDARFFNFTPRNAALMDPQHRLFLETAWQALENAGYASADSENTIGVFAGASMNTYLLNNLYPHKQLFQQNQNDYYQVFIQNDKDFLPTRISYTFNLKGPSVSVQTACSTSLVAVHQAVQSLRKGECNIALAGASSVRAPHKMGYWHQEGMIFSPDGHCKAFDADAQGTVPSNGVGLVVLKSLSKAVEDRDHIYAVIKGSAINNDGDQKVGFTAPSVEGQAKVIAQAQADAGVSASEISYIESHGTGTPLGDPIEIKALKTVFAKSQLPNNSCAIGSVKSNIGHTDTVSGLAGMVKTALSLQNRVLPPSLHVSTPNPKLGLGNSPFFINTNLRDWEIPTGKKRYAGISSFGIGGTNAHIILGEAPQTQTSSKSRPLQLLTLSAKTGSSLQLFQQKLRAFIEAQEEINLADLAYSLNIGRKAFNHKAYLPFTNRKELLAQLTQQLPSANHKEEAQIAWLFTGQGSQRIDMGWPLYQQEPVFQQVVDQCASTVNALIQEDIRLIMFPSFGLKAGKTLDEQQIQQAKIKLNQTEFTQPAIFIFEYALAKLWESWGVKAAVMTGHSIGEYTAACLAGVFSLEDALRIVVMRGKLVQSTNRGSMVSLNLPEHEVQTLLNDQLSLAAINAAQRCVVSGSTEAIRTFIKELESKSIDFRLLHVSHAFHSYTLDGILETFKQELEQVTLHAPNQAYISGLTGTWITDEEAQSADYWVQQLRQTVRFANVLDTLSEIPNLALLEIGPARVLTALSRTHATAFKQKPSIISSDGKWDEANAYRNLLSAAGQLWKLGVAINWKSYYQFEERNRIPLPTYAFERQRFWIEAPETSTQSSSESSDLFASLGATQIDSDDKTDTSRAYLSSTYIAPKTQIEKQLVGVFQELLGFSKIGIEDNFFELGGDSLIATQVANRLKSILGFDYPLKDFLLNPTIASISLYQQTTQHQEPSTSISIIDRASQLPLSYSQQRLFFLTELEGPSATYNMTGAFRLKGTVHARLLEKSFQKVVKRHETLRSSFLKKDGHVQLNINDGSTWQMIHIQAVDQDNQSIEDIIQQKAKYVFQLDAPSLFQVNLIKLDEDDHLLTAAMHHIISDGWSIQVLVREVLACYQAYLKKLEYPLPALPIQFVDYVSWQQEKLAGQQLETLQAFWKTELANAPTVLDFPTDFPRPAIMEFTGANHHFEIDANLSQRIRALSKSADATTFMTLISAFGLMLSKYTGQNDVVIGSPIANRQHPDAEKLIGFFVNTLAFRLGFDQQQSFKNLLTQTKETALNAYAHQDLPFEHLVELLNPSRSLSHTPIFQVMFVLQNTPKESIQLDGLELTPIQADQHVSKFDLTLVIDDQAEAMTAYFEYNTALFKPQTMQLLSNYFLTLLESITSDAEKLLPTYQLMNKTLQEQVLVGWNTTQNSNLKGNSILELFDYQTIANPKQLALQLGNQQLSYQELQEQSNQLAHYLLNQGINKGDVIGVCLNTSFEQILCFLAILKTGAVYLPIDPSYPSKRITYMLEDAQPTVVLSTKTTVSKGSKQATYIYLNDVIPELEKQAVTNPSIAIQGDDFAYIIYTSGSTGKPKGVINKHKGLANLAKEQQAQFSVNATSKVLQFASTSFDASVWEIAMALGNGASLVLASPTNKQAGKVLEKLLHQQAITHATLPPSALALLTDTSIPLTHLIVAGEPCPIQLAEKWAANRQFFNAYGPSETTVCATIHQYQLGSLELPIGMPIANFQTYLVDATLNPVPLGSEGELLLGGEGLAWGYINREELTTATFIDNPFDPKASPKLYRTGDRAKFILDEQGLPHSIVFLGRNDHQVKLRGFRVELGEVEAVLIKHKGVQNCAAIIQKSGENEYLALHWVNATETATTQQDLLAYVKEQLPHYLIPNRWIEHEQLPQLPNGKIDRKALATQNANQQKSNNYLAPRTALELQLVGIWEDILQVKPIGMKDNFFELGGHSLLAVKLISSLESQLNIQLPMASIFQSPTIEHLVHLIENQGNQQEQCLVTIQGNGNRTPIFWVPGVGGHVVSFYELAQELGNDQPFYALQAIGLDGESKPHTDLKEMAAFYVDQIQRIQTEGPYRLGGHSFGAHVAFEIASQLLDAGYEVASLALLDIPAPQNKANERDKWTETQWLLSLIEILEDTVEMKLNITVEQLSRLDFDQQLGLLEYELKTRQLMPELANRKRLKGAIQVFKSSWMMDYLPTQKLPIEVQLYRCKELPEKASAEQLALLQKETMGWEAYAAQVRVIEVSGNHFQMLKQPYVKELAKVIQQTLIPKKVEILTTS